MWGGQGPMDCRATGEKKVRDASFWISVWVHLNCCPVPRSSEGYNGGIEDRLMRGGKNEVISCSGHVT
jgi:hypothetical protein